MQRGKQNPLIFIEFKMENNYVTKVIKHFFKKSYSRDTHARIQHWLIEEEHTEEKRNALYEVWESTVSEKDREAAEALDQVRRGLGMEQRKQRIFRWSGLRVASVFLLMLFLSAGIRFLYSEKEKIQYSTLPGEMKTIRLPDGSRVWLNAETSISYQKAGKRARRLVKLSGEAYFEVASDKRTPFVVETSHLQVEVIGTEFNIEAYPEDSRTTATLHTGRIRVDVPDRSLQNDSYFLEPDQQLIYDPLAGVEILPVHSEEVKGWQEGHLLFPNTCFKDIINKLQRHFNVEIVIDDFENSGDYYSVKFIHGESLEQIIQVLQGMEGDFSYEIRK